MDFELSEDQRAFQQTARNFAAGEMAPHAAEWDAECIFPVDVIQKAGALGFCSMYTPEDVGGMGLSRLDAAIVFEELAITACQGACHNPLAQVLPLERELFIDLFDTEDPKEGVNTFLEKRAVEWKNA